MTLKQIGEVPEAAALMDRILPGMREKFSANPQAVNLSLAKLAEYASLEDYR